jgi:hypothetical protein
MSIETGELHFVCADTKGMQGEILNMLSQSHKYMNVLGICRDIDYKTFRETVLYQNACICLEHYESHYTHFCSENYDPALVKFRREIRASCRIFLFYKYSKDTEPHILKNFPPPGYMVIRFGGRGIERLKKILRESRINIEFCYPIALWGVKHIGDELGFVAENEKELDPKNQKDNFQVEMSHVKEVAQVLRKIRNGHFVELTDDINSPLNSPNMFVTVTHIIRIMYPRIVLASIDVCRDIKEEVEQSQARKGEGNMYLDAL